MSQTGAASGTAAKPVAEPFPEPFPDIESPKIRTASAVTTVGAMGGGAAAESFANAAGAAPALLSPVTGDDADEGALTPVAGLLE